MLEEACERELKLISILEMSLQRLFAADLGRDIMRLDAQQEDSGRKIYLHRDCLRELERRASSVLARACYLHMQLGHGNARCRSVGIRK